MIDSSTERGEALQSASPTSASTNDKNPFLFPLLLFGIFFLLIAITGSFQIAITKRNMEGLLQGEGDILYRSITREIEINMDYLNLLARSPSIITPSLIDLMNYDEEIVDGLYTLVSRTPAEKLSSLPFSSLLITDRNGKTIMRRGAIKVPRSSFKPLVDNTRLTTIRMPGGRQADLVLGLRVDDRLVFLALSEQDLESLRKKYILKSIIENEEKRPNIAGINIYDEKGGLYLGSREETKGVLRITKPLSSRYFPGYTMEVLVSTGLADDFFKRTSMSLLALLLFLVLGGAAAIYVIFFLEGKHAQRLQEMEKEMAMKERLVSLGKLASGMAHEIRNPLNAISMSVQRLKREFLPEVGQKEEYYKFIDIMRAELTRVNRIVEEFLLSSKVRAPWAHEKIRALLDEVTLMLQERAESKGIRVINTASAELGVECQRERLKQAFYNLLVNAMEAMERGGQILIGAEVEDGAACIAITDTGPGIRKEDQLRIFDYYYTTKDKGIGLGLPISYMIVKDHGGDIQVASDEGKGATFTVRLPLRRPPDETETRETSSRPDLLAGPSHLAAHPANLERGAK